MKRPNILWLMTDEQRKDSMGCYGSPWARTPNLDRLAGQGVVFDAAYTPSPVCHPARTSICVGQYPAETGVWANVGARGPDWPLLPPKFAEAGYRTASFGKSHYAGDRLAFETEQQLTLSKHVHYFRYESPHEESQFDVVKYPRDRNAWIFAGRFPADAAETAEAISVQRAIAWVDEAPREPFLLRVSVNAPHTPVAPPAEFDRLIDPDDVDLPEAAELPPADGPAWAHRLLASWAAADRLTPAQIRRMRGSYYGQVAFVDQQFGVLLDALAQRGLLDNTIIVMLSDHGTHLGDYGLVQKQTFYDVSACVPMLVVWPGHLPAGRRIATPVSAGSLLPTLLDLADIEVPATVSPDLPSLAPLLRGEAEATVGPVFSGLTLESVDLGGDRLMMVRQGGWKLSLRVDPEPQDHYLVNLAEDPLELVNRYGDATCKAVQAELEGLIVKHLRHAAPMYRKAPRTLAAATRRGVAV